MLSLEEEISVIEKSIELLREERDNVHKAEGFVYQTESDLYSIEHDIHNNDDISVDVEDWKSQNVQGILEELKEHIDSNIDSLEKAQKVLEEKIKSGEEE